MSAIIVFHGGTQVIDEPVCKFGRQNLDFGAGFYVTDLREGCILGKQYGKKPKRIPNPQQLQDG